MWIQAHLWPYAVSSPFYGVNMEASQITQTKVGKAGRGWGNTSINKIFVWSDKYANLWQKQEKNTQDTSAIGVHWCCVCVGCSGFSLTAIVWLQIVVASKFCAVRSIFLHRCPTPYTHTPKNSSIEPPPPTHTHNGLMIKLTSLSFKKMWFNCSRM